VAFERGKKSLSTRESAIIEKGCQMNEKLAMPTTLYSNRQKGMEAKHARLLVRQTDGVTVKGKLYEVFFNSKPQLFEIVPFSSSLYITFIGLCELVFASFQIVSFLLQFLDLHILTERSLERVNLMQPNSLMSMRGDPPPYELK
jgi:hypothetical protein